MFCPHCGARAEDGAAVCPACGQTLTPAAPPAEAAPPVEATPDASAVKDYLTVNIVLLALSVCCCGSLPAVVTGIIGVIFSSQTRDLLRFGRSDEAARKSRAARNLAIATGVILGVTALIALAFVALYGTVIAAMFASLS